MTAMPHDPRTLFVLFDDLGQLLLRWTTSVERFAEETRIAAIEASEAVTGLQRRASQAQEIAAEMARLVERLEADCQAMLEDVRQADEFAHEQHEHASTVVGEGETAESSWRAGLGRAQDQLSRARDELRRAQAALASAQQRLSQAQSELRYAQSALSSCRSSYRTDQQGRRIYNNCSGEAARVGRANSEVAAAQGEVSAAEAEVNRTQAEVDRCVRVVAQCEAGLSRAQRIVGDARNNRENSSASLDSASRASAEVEDAGKYQRDAELARGRLGELAQEAAEQVAMLMQLGESLPQGREAVAQLSRQQADLHLSAKRLLADLDEQLRAFDSAATGMLT